MASSRLARPVFAAFALLLAGCAASLPKSGAIAPATYSQSLETDVSRHYLVHVPKGYDPARSYPLVIALHGAFDSAELLEETTGFSELADREGFVVAYPNGIGLLGFLRHWNAGFCCGKAKYDGWDDVGFLVELIDDLAARLSIDKKRVALVGFSNGGMLAYRFAAEHREKVAAIVAVSAAFGAQEDEEPEMRSFAIPEPPLPTLVIHARDDSSIPLDGGQSPRRPEIRYLGPKDAVAHFVQLAGCGQEPKEERQRGYVVRTWSGCAPGGEVALFEIDEGGHAWPRRREDGSGVDATEAAWSFLSRWLQRPE
ncbi:MAG: alpha/beta hydrolase family esterase [Myxococcales bacterium]|jgi:polyhydroxybutyrate depolymerase